MPGRGKNESENRVEREKSRALMAWEGEFGGCVLNRNGPAHSCTSHPNSGQFIGQARGPSSARISPPRAKGTGLKRETRRGALPFDLRPQSSHPGCCAGPAKKPKVHPPFRGKSRDSPPSFKSKRGKVA